MNAREKFSCYIIGAQSLLVQCAELLLEAGHEILGVITSDDMIGNWATERGIRRLDSRGDYLASLREQPFDYFFSITNLSIIPAEVLALPRRGAINFHDGPLPRYGGLYATAWALINREPTHGVTWHLMTNEVDRGDILEQEHFEIDEGETSLTLNAKCYEAGIGSFRVLLSDLAGGQLRGERHALDESTYCPRSKRPAAASTLSWDCSAADLAALVRALDFGTYPNPLGLPKMVLGDEVVVATRADLAPRTGAAPGTLVGVGEDTLQVATTDDDLVLAGFHTLSGRALRIEELLAGAGLRQGALLPALGPARRERLTLLNAAVCRHESFWIKRLMSTESVDLPYLRHTPEGMAAPYSSLALRLPDGAGAPAGRSFEGSRADFVVAALGAYLSRLGTKETFYLGFRDSALARAVEGVGGWFAEEVPLRIDLEGVESGGDALARVGQDIALLRERVTYGRDLVARTPELRGMGEWAPKIVLEVGGAVLGEGRGEALRVVVAEDGRECHWVFREGAFGASDIERMQAQFSVFIDALSAAPEAALRELPLLGESERRRVLEEWNATTREIPEELCVHELIEAQVERTPAASAIVFQGEELSYRELNERANRLAHHLRSLGVGPEVLVGLCLERSVEMVVSVLAVHKAGGAYLPLDPSYPIERLALMLEDSEVGVVLIQERLREKLAGYGGRILSLDAEADQIATSPGDNPVSDVAPENLAYIIYTSGSTGRPKGVMIEHRNVVNFFTGMDEQVGGEEPGVWLAVTSLSFDISVLELLWTLARGYQVVLYADQERRPVPAGKPVGTHGSARIAASAGATGSGATAGIAAAGGWPAREAAGREGPEAAMVGNSSSSAERSGNEIDFSLFYFSGDENENDRDKYRLLLEGARYGDANGFTAVWTPERHFHAFGGLYPNPAVTGAAVAAVTERVQIRAGSVVLPLHHPIRVAEEWSVVDNISGGRVGISFASGWQPNDFVLRPENYAEAKQVMERDIETVRRLWRGESITLENPLGKPTEIRTLPRPIQPELPFWVTSAGNPATFELAGRMGARVLTHLLGQSVDELAGKLEAYRRAWREAGHPGEGYVSLMLHTFVGEAEAMVRETVREPLTNYLRTATNLVKQYAWSFPAFKKQDDELDFQSLTEEEMEALLAYSFERYYQTSGLFGTPESCVAMIDKLKAIGVDDVACLIDFGVDSETVLAHLEYLNRLRELTSRPGEEAVGAAVGVGAEPVDYSIPALIARHRVTHLQCTPSMAGMLLADDRTREAFRTLRRVMIGGEAFPAPLAAELQELVAGEVLNMYGPTETTVWSTIHPLGNERVDAIPIGRPIANTEIYIVDAQRQPLPVGVAGELLIGGKGVVRGYLRRPELTAEVFIPHPFSSEPGARLYRTGDLARYRSDGVLEFLGRLDHQVKIRGYRIELGEIEALLAAHPAVREAAAVVREEVAGDKRIVAYTVPRPGQSAPAAELRDYLRAQLPEFMVPSHFVTLAQMPRTPNAKIDRKTLPAPDAVAPIRSAEQASFMAPRSEVEETIAGIWRDVLRVPQVGTDDNFFDLGGHSLLAVQVHSRLNKAFERAISITDLFRFPTVGALAGYLGQESGAEETAPRAGADRAALRRQSMMRRQQLRPGR